MPNLTRKIKTLVVIAIVGIAGLLGACSKGAAQWNQDQVSTQYAQIINSTKAQLDSENVAFSQELANAGSPGFVAAAQETLVEWETTISTFETQVAALETHTSGTAQVSLQEAVVAANNEAQIIRQSVTDLANGDVNAVAQDEGLLPRAKTTFYNAVIAAGNVVGVTFNYGA